MQLPHIVKKKNNVITTLNQIELILGSDSPIKVMLKADFLHDFEIKLPEYGNNDYLNISSFSEKKVHYKVDLVACTCSCPDFSKNRIMFRKGSIKRLCKHQESPTLPIPSLTLQDSTV